MDDCNGVEVEAFVVATEADTVAHVDDANVRRRFEIKVLEVEGVPACFVDVERIDDWKDPDFLVRVTPLASRLSLTWGQNVTQDLRMVTIR